jgi:hypothetical protein
MHCKQIRDGDGQWVRLEQYVQDHSHANRVCPACLKKHYPSYKGPGPT